MAARDVYHEQSKASRIKFAKDQPNKLMPNSAKKQLRNANNEAMPEWQKCGDRLLPQGTDDNRIPFKNKQGDDYILSKYPKAQAIDDD